MGDGSPATTGNVQNIAGSGICTGITFDYPYKSEADGYVDYFSPDGGAIIFESQDGLSRAGCYTGPTGGYRTITSSVFFSVFEENGTTRQELMAIYREFMLGGTGIDQQNGAVSSPVLLCVPSPAAGSLSATVTVAGPSQCSLDVFDLSGRRVGTLADGMVPAGSSSFAIPAAGLPSGTYMVSGRVAGRIVSGRTVLLD